MMKGQDTVALPLLSLGAQNEDELLENLKNMSTNGLRTLVCGFAELDNNWWGQRSSAYQAIIQRDTTAHSEGHPDKCNHEKCEKCAQHDFFEQVEKDAGLAYCGTLGLEDQLQLLVPECIGDCIRGGIKGEKRACPYCARAERAAPPLCAHLSPRLLSLCAVWMITGDKLETAKNIGLACVRA